MTVVDVPVRHPPGVALQAASAARDAAAAAQRDAEKHRAYNQLAPDGYPLVPFSEETYGRLGKLAVALLGMLGPKAMRANPALSLQLLGELSVGLCKGDCLMHQALVCWLGLLAEASVRERISLSRMCVTSGVLCAVR
jgi:hypothetical protein